MGENSNIEWTTHTFNPWVGCTKVSEGCRNCYAEARSKRFPQQGQWGPGARRVRTGKANWRKPLAWNRSAEPCTHPVHENPGLIVPCPECGGEAGPVTRPRVFCASLADWLDDEVPAEWLADLLALIAATPYLDWLLLTKRPQNWRPRLEAAHEVLFDSCRCEGGKDLVARKCSEDRCSHRTTCPVVALCSSCMVFGWLRGEPPPHVWLGTSVEDQDAADERIPALLQIPARVRFLSCEPLLGKVDLSEWLCNEDELAPEDLDWVIAGGESGKGARPMHPEWARSLRDQCQEAGVPFFWKQWGAWIPDRLALPSEGVYDFGDGMRMRRVGKKKAGRELDGRTWDEVPQAAW